MASERTKALLVGILKAGGIMTIVLLAPGAAPALELFVKNKRTDKGNFNRTLKRLEASGLIEVSSKDGQIVIALKPEGKKRAVVYSLEDMTIAKPKKWDKKWRVVIFDIPEKHKSARYYLKSKLDELGFVQLQKSTYIHPYPCEEQVRSICSAYGVNDYVNFILADRIDGQNNLEARYHLMPK